MTPISKNEVEEILHKLIDQVTAGDDEPLLADELTFAEQATKQITLLLERREAEAWKKGEAHGRRGVILAVKDWADDTEVTYNTLLETELNKVDQIEASLNQGGEDK